MHSVVHYVRCTFAAHCVRTHYLCIISTMLTIYPCTLTVHTVDAPCCRILCMHYELSARAVLRAFLYRAMVLSPPSAVELMPNGILKARWIGRSLRPRSIIYNMQVRR